MRRVLIEGDNWTNPFTWFCTHRSKEIQGSCMKNVCLPWLAFSWSSIRAKDLVIEIAPKKCKSPCTFAIHYYIVSSFTLKSQGNLRRPITDIALLSYIARKKADVISYTEAVKACRSSSSASRALHQLIGEGLIEPKPKLLGLRYVTQYVITQKGKQASNLALQLVELREISARGKEVAAPLVEKKSQVVMPSPQKKSSKRLTKKPEVA